MTRRRRYHPRSHQSRVSYHQRVRGIVTLWAALFLGLGWAMQGVPLLVHLVSAGSESCQQQVNLPWDQANNHADHAALSDLGRGDEPGSGRLARHGSDHGGHHDPLGCQTCKALMISGAWAVPHVPALVFFEWTPVGAVQVALPERAISFELWTLAVPRGPPNRAV